MKSRRITTAMLAAVTVLCATTSLASAAADQARLDAAMEAFNERMTAAGWESQGPVDDEDDDDDDEDDAAESAGEEAFGECFGEMPAIFDTLDTDEFPGQIAASESEEFVWTPPSEATATTEELSFDFAEETAAAFAATVDDANVSTVTEFIDVFGAKETGDCIREGLEAEMAAESEDSEIPVEFDINVSNESDLGIGDHSAELRFDLSTVFMVPISLHAQVVFAQVGNDLYGVAYSLTGDEHSEFDARAELQTIVDSLGE